MQIDTIFDAAPDAVVVIDEEGRIIQWNPRAELMFGWTFHEVTGKLLSETIIPERYREAHRKGMARYLDTGKATILNKTVEIQASTKDNRELDVALSISPTIVKGKHIFIGFIRDVSEHKKAQERIRESKEIFSTLFYKSPVMNSITDTSTGEYIDVNDSYAFFCGLQREQMIGKTAMQLGLFNPDDRARIISEVEKHTSLRNKELLVNVHDEAKWISMNIDKIMLFDRYCYLAAMLDITDRKKGEDKFRRLLESAPDAIVIVNERGVIQLVNAQTLNLFNYSREELTGQHVELLMPFRYGDMHKSHRGNYFKSPRARQMGSGFDLLGRKKNGEEFPVEISLSPLETEEGLLVSAAIRDISEKKRLEHEIKEANVNLEAKVIQRTAELERKNRDLEQFAYVASHDLQEPLRTTSSFVQLLNEKYHDKLDEEANQILEYMLQGSERMKTLIKDLLDYSRIGRKTELRDIDCNTILREVVADLDTSFREAEAIIEIEPLPQLRGYPTELKLLFQNLISNALKFRRKNEGLIIKISAKQNKNYWQFSVTDNGIGIDEKFRERIFIIFQRLHVQSEYDGSGIGLAHCKKIVELHNGSIWVESVPDKGSTFYFTIQLM
jgi:PAS domain S-box-containing protein